MASAGVHLLLLSILLFGSAFLQSGDSTAPVHPIHVYDPSLVTDALTHGGSQNVPELPAPPPTPPAPPQQAQPAPPPTPIVPTPPPQRQPQIPAPDPVVKPKRIDPVEEPRPEKTPRLTADDLKLNKPSKNSKPPKNSTASNDKAREAADARKRQIAFTSAMRSISTGMSAHTSIESDLQAGPGDGGPLSANYRDLVASKYTDAWTPPPDLDDDSATVVVSVTIDRDGNVMSGHITKHSGNAAMDRSIENTLEKVTFIEPFPAGSKDQQRTYTIKFNLQAKRSLG